MTEFKGLSIEKPFFKGMDQNIGFKIPKKDQNKFFWEK